ncbi:GntR family transcriptional regulator [Spirochaeta isovalerica]|uniref:GntR family transcriptional regulator n=1 Tax=Spirochaeta isovalerica TaxID=150 RepID=A0A841RA37_9SPIO|nr:GntR family transcriptional regulator [Spirochaeta isovalerica]MBB6479312.1 GntR family transcriptional regulator [Spirochaeta isovalerica]
MKIVKEPMYQQLTGILREMIQSDQYKSGDKFLTEGEISSRYEVSRNTVNKAMTALISEGLLEFRKGLGSFIKTKHSQYDLHSLISFTKMAEAMGAKAQTKVLQFRKVKGRDLDDTVLAALGGEPKSDFYFMQRLRLLNERPSILEERYVSAKLCPGLKKSDVSGSIISMWIDKYNLTLAGADQTLSAVLAGNEEAALLQMNEGEAVMLRESTGFADGNTPLWYERTLFNGGDYVFRFRVESMNAAHTAKSVFVGDN